MSKLKSISEVLVRWFLPVLGFVMAALAIAGVDRFIILLVIGSGLAIYVAAFTAWGKLGAVAKTLRWFFVGNTRIVDSLNRLEGAVQRANQLSEYSAQSILGARVLYLDRMTSPVFFIHSHRPENIHEHVRRPAGTAGVYVRPAIPVDEAPFIELASHWAASSRSLVMHSRVETVCSCQLDESELGDNLIIFGSSKFNDLTSKVEDAASSPSRDWLRLRFVNEKTTARGEERDAEAVIEGIPGGTFSGKLYRPDAIRPRPSDGSILRDYGLLTRIPNPLASAESDATTYAVIVGGCHRAAQKGLTEWLSRPNVLHELLVAHGDRAFQAVISLTYKFALDPDVDFDSIEIAASSDLDIRLA